MAECCDPVPYRRLFNTKEAERRLRRYRKSGLDTRIADAVGYLAGRGIGGLSVLEVGGGVGDVGIEMLDGGATSVVNIELSDAYEPSAAALLDERGLARRVDRRVGDFVQLAEGLSDADVVVLNRVVCCYPDMPAMVSAAAARATRFLALVYPVDRWWTKAGSRLGNWFMAARRCDFRAFVHPVAGIDAITSDHGLAVVHRSRDLVWETTVYEHR